jgi:hypothetical protein
MTLRPLPAATPSRAGPQLARAKLRVRLAMYGSLVPPASPPHIRYDPLASRSRNFALVEHSSDLLRRFAGKFIRKLFGALQLRRAARSKAA